MERTSAERRQTLENLGLCELNELDAQLESLAKLASMTCETTGSAITILDDEYLWVEGSFNFPFKIVSRIDSICFHGLTAQGIFQIEDLSKDKRFVANPFVVEKPHLRFYAGAPLIAKNGVKIGFLCILDLQPKSLTASQRRSLEILAQQVMFAIESRVAQKEAKANWKMLEDLQNYQKAVIENVPSLIYIKNAKKEMSYSLMNPACQKIFGVNEIDILGKKDFDFLPTDLARQLSATDTFAFSNRKGIKIEKEEISTSQGQRFFTIYKVPVFDEDNQPEMLIVIMRDITEEVLYKADLELERMKSIHNAKLATIGEITAGVAHEINNPLAVIAGSISLLEKLKNCPEQFDTKLKAIYRSLDRISRIVKNLKKFSRYSEAYSFSFVPISNIVKEAIEMVSTKAADLGVEVRVTSVVDIAIFCSDLEIEQVIVNLVSNSIDAIRNLPERWIEISTFVHEEKVILRIKDSGRGIDSKIEKKLFEPFFTTKPAGEGTGLGLSISKDILSRHEATIRLNREFNNTCFEICFRKLQEASNAS